MSTPVTTSLNPWGRPFTQANVVRAHQKGRICAHEGCATVLSIYNPTTHCAAHAGEQPGRRGALAPLREVACENCGGAFQTRNPRRSYCGDRCRMAAFSRRRRSSQRSDAPVAVGSRSWRVPDDVA